MHSTRARGPWIVALLMLSASSALAQSAAPPPAPDAQQPAPQQASPQPQQAYPQTQAYPQQAYPQQAYPQQAYPQQAYPQQQAYQPPQGYQQPPPGYVAPGYQQPYYNQQYPGPRARRRHPSRALLITGASIFGGAYLISAMVGAILIDNDNDNDGYDYDDCRNCRATGRWLFLPLAGPWVAMKETRDDGGLAFLGMLQLVGAGLTVGGIIRFLNTKRALESGIAQWDLGKGRTLTLDTKTSPLLTGPQMKLQF